MYSKEFIHIFVDVFAQILHTSLRNLAWAQSWVGETWGLDKWSYLSKHVLKHFDTPARFIIHFFIGIKSNQRKL